MPDQLQLIGRPPPPPPSDSALGVCLYCGDRTALGSECVRNPGYRHTRLTLDSTLGQIAAGLRVSGATVQLLWAEDGIVVMILHASDLLLTPVPADAPAALALAEDLRRTILSDVERVRAALGDAR